MLHAALLLSPDALAVSYPDALLAQLREEVGELTVVPAAEWRAQKAALAGVDVIFSGWGAPRMDEEFLAHVPRLKAVFYAGGSVRYFVTEAFWRRGIRLTSAQSLNAIPVAEYTVAVLVLGLKRFWHYAQLTRTTRSFPADRPLAGNFETTIGLVSYGTIARLVRRKLKEMDVKVLVYDPHLPPEEALTEEVTLCGLDDLFVRSDAVSVHTPVFPETVQLIKGTHLARLKPGAVFVNTARGEVINELEMTDVLRQRPDVQAVLDVTWPEPPAATSPLYSLPNVALTPHLAGSVGPECRRMGEAMREEFARFRAGEKLRWELTPGLTRLLA